ncbi:MAG: hypothetical protein QOJ16_4964 [Acidobacteriota bacterium]|nr:hypothetical protein [Acidobacteriota bacterium]
MAPSRDSVQPRRPRKKAAPGGAASSCQYSFPYLLFTSVAVAVRVSVGVLPVPVTVKV